MNTATTTIVCHGATTSGRMVNLVAEFTLEFQRSLQIVLGLVVVLVGGMRPGVGRLTVRNVIRMPDIFAGLRLQQLIASSRVV